MNKTTKLVLSLIGLAAVIVPVILLIVFSSREQSQPNVEVGPRQVNPKTVEDAVGKFPPPSATPLGATPSAQPGATGSAR